MYVTRPLSLYKKSPSALSDPPPEGPGSGILVVQDVEAQPKCCFGLARTDKIRELPIPQNKSLELYYSQGFSRDRDLHFHSVWFIPVLGLPLSSNTYYALHPLGKDRGEAFVSAKEEDLEAFCCYLYAPETQPQPFDPTDPFQQMQIKLHGRKITPWGSDFELKSAAPEGFAPGFLGRKEGWKLYVNCEAVEFDLPDDARGLDKAMRERLPDLDFSPGTLKSDPVVVGKWYVPFVFVREGAPRTMRDERRASMFYSATLELRWDRIYERENDGSGNSVAVDCSVRSEVAVVGGREAVVDDKDEVGSKTVWFRSEGRSGEEVRVGLSSALVERIKWEEEKGGFSGVGKGREVRVERREECKRIEWKRFGCYVLVERFVFKRMDGSLALSYEFRHTHQIRTKWE